MPKRNHNSTSITTNARQQLTEAMIRLEEYRLATDAMINSLGEGLFAVNELGEITLVNTYALRALGYTREELIGKWFSGVIVAVDQHSRPWDPLARPITRALTSGQPVSEYLYYLRKDGTTIPVFITASPILIRNKPVGVIESFRDLTEEKRLDIAKEEFVSLASHQLRTPATGVKSILAMLSRGDFGPLTDQQLKYIERAIGANDRQLQIIEDLLNVARVDAGRMELAAAEVDLARLVRSVAADQIEAAQSRRQTIQVSGPANLLLWADEAKLHMVIDNLLSNASKYSPDGETIEITLRGDKSHVQIEVADHGVGVAKADQPRLFSKFGRFENDRSELAGGTGLGLFLAKSLVQLHQGDITLVSKPGEGSIFTITLPRKQQLQP